jgi:hypothetical protein
LPRFEGVDSENVGVPQTSIQRGRREVSIRHNVVMLVGNSETSAAVARRFRTDEVI